jgi:UDP-glucose 4-epimerase
VKILVTGGAGFIGTQTANTLFQAGHEVVVLDNFSTGSLRHLNPEIKIIDKNISEYRPTCQFEIIYHFAAQTNLRHSISDPINDANYNIINTLRVCEWAAFWGSKIIFSSTGGALYGETPYPVDETFPINPDSPYGLSKYACERYIRLLSRLHGFDFTILRYSNVFGPTQNPKNESGVISIFIKALKDNQGIKIFGTGDQIRDFIFIDDVVKANLVALSETGTHNISTGIETSIKFVAGALGLKSPEFCPSKPGEVLRSVLKPSGCFGGWKPEIVFLDGLRKTLENFDSR